MNRLLQRSAGFLLALLLSGTVSGAAGLKTKNILLVTIDGLRWQEVFRGEDAALANKEFGGVADQALAGLQAKYWADSVPDRRRALLPFFWNEIARHGQLYGNRDTGSPAQVSNAEWISYPGYNELLTGAPDPAITSNALTPNPNVTVLEWLNGRPAFAGRVRACAAWHVFPAILNTGRSGLPLWITGQHSAPDTVSPRVLELERLMDDIPPPWRVEHYDAFVLRRALDHLETDRPRVLYVGLGEPDEWAHARRYDHYLASITNCDRFIRELWDRLQSLPEYRGTTTLIVSPDHGRGATPQDWNGHGRNIPRSNETWLAVLGPDTPPLGERRDTSLVTQAQIAATVAALLGEDYRSFRPDAGAVLPEVFPADGK